MRPVRGREILEAMMAPSVTLFVRNPLPLFLLRLVWSGLASVWGRKKKKRAVKPDGTSRTVKKKRPP
jgi:hypothetical protein